MGNRPILLLDSPILPATSPMPRELAHPSSRTLYWPYGVFSDGERLWIADTGNRRLYFDALPTAHFSPAQQVIGKPDFNSRDYENQDPIWPYSVKIGPTGAMAVADTQYYRILLWNDWKKAFDNRADSIIGRQTWMQMGRTNTCCTQCPIPLAGVMTPVSTSKQAPVADTGNSRILQFHNLPQASNLPADGLIGKPDFFTGSENAETVFGTENNLYWPF